MSTRFKEVDRKTRYLFPESVDEWLPEDHLARFVVEIVDNLDIAHIENEYRGNGGKTAYHPRMLLSLIFYGYATGVFSSRKVESQLIVLSDVTQQTNDKEALRPALEALKELPEALSRPRKLLADAGYHSEENLAACEEAEVEAYIPARRETHYWDVVERFKPAEADEVPCETPSARTRQRLRTKAGREIFSKRKCTIEPVFGVIKAVMGFRQFLFRGLRLVRYEWKLVCMAWNLKRLHKISSMGLRRSSIQA